MNDDLGDARDNLYWPCWLPASVVGLVGRSRLFLFKIAHVFASEIINRCLFFAIVSHILFTQINHHMEKVSLQFSSIIKWDSGTQESVCNSKVSRIDIEEKSTVKQGEMFFPKKNLSQLQKRSYSNPYLVVRQKYTFVFSCEISLQWKTGHCIVSPALNVLLLWRIVRINTQ